MTNGINRPLPFLVAISRSSITVPISPVGPTTMSQVRLAISPARRPALAANKTITRLRRGCRVQLAKASIFACLPGIRRC